MSIDYEWLAAERFRNTKLYGYDQVCRFFDYRLSERANPLQITTVSQNAINRQIQLLHTDSAADSPLRQFTTDTSKNDDYTHVIRLPCHKAVLTKQHSQIVNAKLDSSTVELLLGTDEKQTVLFTLKIKSGTFNYWGGTRGNPIKRNATIKDWRVVSRVRLNLLELEAKNVPKFIRDMLTNPNDYSIRQLLIDFTTADISTYDPTLSVIDDDEAREDFHKHVKMYWDGLKAKENGSHSTIHYLPTLKKPDSYLAPTIVPTSLNFQNFPFVRSSMATEGEKNNDNNMLIYLQMTEKRKFPPDLLPFPKANSFLDGWLLPRLAQFNNTTTWYSVIDDAPSKVPAPYSLDGGHFGPPGYENAKSTPWKYDAAASNSGILKYTYTVDGVTKRKSAGQIKFAQQKVNVWNHLEIPVGLNANGESVIKTIDGLNWTAELVLRTEARGTENGKLKIEIRNVQSKPHEGEQGYSWAPEDVKRQLTGILESVRSHVSGKEHELSETMNHLKGDVDKLFGKSWEFIFGGNDDFYIDKAGFNRRVS
ncbi:hypothetical protein HWV62_12374 [Athelia sp. TMB]|nr:hypothetical protein HWV62_12374 [Athelia sp. TMB]